jgi:hypothetical protein
MFLVLLQQDSIYQVTLKFVIEFCNFVNKVYFKKSQIPNSYFFEWKISTFPFCSLLRRTNTENDKIYGDFVALLIQEVLGYYTVHYFRHERAPEQQIKLQ